MRHTDTRLIDQLLKSISLLLKDLVGGGEASSTLLGSYCGRYANVDSFPRLFVLWKPRYRESAGRPWTVHPQNVSETTLFYEIVIIASEQMSSFGTQYAPLAFAGYGH